MATHRTNRKRKPRRPKTSTRETKPEGYCCNDCKAKAEGG